MPADSVLENQLRARLAAELKPRSTSASELAVALGEPLALVTYHCRVLEQFDGPAPSGSS
ncbi:MAG TPA: hypothetical protein VGN84_08915 [Solirubrobacterales bacterium]|nr:hypothetical protein [Solirubrobacterales bacterium]